MERKELSEENKQKNRLDYLSKPLDSFEMDKGSLEQSVVYIFSENKKDSQFVSGEYSLHTSDKELFVEFANTLKAYLSDSLVEPYANDLSVLGQVYEALNQSKSVKWDGTDGSMLTISIGALQSEGEETEYLIKIKTNAPLPDGKSLK
ncbi:hypothetical protein [Gracilibacillus halophilus]|nr:hypothetical protein [Gracilibacillus halophilus]